MLRYLTLIVLVALLVSPLAASGQENIPQLLIPSGILALPNDQIVIPVDFAINGHPNVHAVEFTLDYDEALLGPCDYAVGDGSGIPRSDSVDVVTPAPLRFFGAVCDPNVADGEIVVGLIIENNHGSLPDGTLVNVTLPTGNPSGPAEATIEFAEAMFVTGGAKLVLGTTSGSTLIFCPDFAGSPGVGIDELDILAESWHQEYPAGDCDMDSNITVKDIACVSRSFRETCPPPAGN